MGDMRVWRFGTWVFVALILLELAFLYSWSRGVVPATWTAVQPDSSGYICRGFEVAGYSVSERVSATAGIFSDVGYSPQSCATLVSEGSTPYQVYSRVVLPSSIALVAVLGGSFSSGAIAALLPSMLFFGAVALMWWVIVARGCRGEVSARRQWSALVILALPFMAFSVVLWPAAILTEGPWLLFLLAMVVIISDLRESTGRLHMAVLALALAVVGLLALASRQSWPIVAAFWGYGMFLIASKLRTSSAASVTLSAAASLPLAYFMAWMIERLTFPTDAFLGDSGRLDGETKDSYTGFRLDDALADPLGLLGGAVSSAAGDLQIALMRGDVASLVVFVVAFVALAWLVFHRYWGWVLICGSAWALGAYSLGILQSSFQTNDTHFRFLLAPIFLSIAAAWLSWSRRGSSAHPSEQESVVVRGRESQRADQHPPRLER